MSPAFARADIRELERDIYSTGFYKNKAKNIIGAAGQIIERHGGEVPESIEEAFYFPFILPILA